MFHWMFLCFLVYLTTETFTAKNPEAKLIQHLFKDYTLNARPSDGKTAVNLTYDIALRQMVELDEKQQIMTTSVWIRHYWHDLFLTWNETEWNGTSYLAVTPDMIWKPDITLYNNAEREFQGFADFGKTRVNMYSSGLMVWLVPMILRSECKLSMKYFPFDTQFCPLVFGSWAYDGGALDFHPKNPKGDLSSFSESGEFVIDGLGANRISKKYGCCPNPYVTITFTIRLQRRVKFYLFNLIIPGILIALLSFFSFFLPPLSGERISLIITNFLALSVYVLMVSDSIPPSSESVPLLVKFYTIMICEIAFALILNCAIIPLAVRKTKIPRIIQYIFFGNIAKILLCTTHQVEDDKKSKTMHDHVNSFSLDTIIESNGVNANGNIQTITSDKENKNKDNLYALNDEIAEKFKRSTSRKSYFLKTTMDYLSSIADILEDGAQLDKNVDNWELLINVLDRILFFLFLISLLISVGLLVNEAPEIRL